MRRQTDERADKRTDERMEIVTHELLSEKHIEDEKMNSKENNIKVSNTILKWDRVMLVFYFIAFGSYNVGYFMNYYL